MLSVPGFVIDGGRFPGPANTLDATNRCSHRAKSTQGAARQTHRETCGACGHLGGATSQFLAPKPPLPAAPPFGAEAAASSHRGSTRGTARYQATLWQALSRGPRAFLPIWLACVAENCAHQKREEMTSTPGWPPEQGRQDSRRPHRRLRRINIGRTQHSHALGSRLWADVSLMVAKTREKWSRKPRHAA